MTTTTNLTELAAKTNRTQYLEKAVAFARARFPGIDFDKEIRECEIGAIVSALHLQGKKGATRLAWAIVGEGINLNGSRRFKI